MAGYGADLDETPRWRLSVLFMVIVVLSLGAHIGLHSLQEYFRRQKRKGLKHTLQTLTDELFALGLITLILIVCQDQLIKICIDGDSGSSDYDKYTTKNRKLLAGYSDFKCPKGQESLWSITALHEIHILIFIIAVVHLAQAAFSMIISELRVRRWKKYEDRENHNMVPLKRTGAIKIKGSWIVLYIQSFFTQFTDSIDGPVYLAIRRLFIEKMELDDDFNFYDFVVDSMEEGFAKMVEFQWLMWLIAAVYILLPWEAYTVIWMPCLFLGIVLIIGAKLQSIAIQLASLAYTHYTPNFIPRKGRSRTPSMLKKGASSLKNMFSKKSAQSGQDDSARSAVPRVEHGTQQNGVVEQELAVRVEQPGSQVRQGAGVLKQNQSSVAEYLAQRELLYNSRTLFWFGKPGLMLRVFQYIYFQSGLIISLLILDEWRGQSINHLSSHAIYLVMIGVCLLVMVLSALFVIPIYAITFAAGAYTPDKVLRKAIKKSVNPELARKLNLERRSMASSQVSADESVEDDHGHDHGHGHDDHDHGHGHGHGHDDSRLQTLLAAMDHSQVRKQRLQEQGHGDHQESV
eukprot:TRINITY_DN386_c1_g1_i13.p1 TRINITY_DN386_c1_g1~~TRINITY_DN386_c1_g1_i13.p1  ORF type:complete len:615 (+),score=37.89 TRINITY_DN386_c1_g1_i13:129-1847(+)